MLLQQRADFSMLGRAVGSARGNVFVISRFGSKQVHATSKQVMESASAVPSRRRYLLELRFRVLGV